MKKYLPIIFTLLIIPSVTFAAWWNPLTWFGPNGTNDQQPIQQVIIPENQTLTAQQQSSTTESLPTVANIDIATSTTPVQTHSSPASDQSQLKAQMNSLTAQNNLLKSRLATVENQLTVVQNNYAMCQTNLLTAQSSLTNTQSRVQQSEAVSATTPSTSPSAVISPDAGNLSKGSSSAINGQVSGLPVLIFDIQPSSQGQSLNSLTVDVNALGQGNVTSASLYSGNATVVSNVSVSPIATAQVINGSATFSNIPSSGTVIKSLSSLRFPVGPYNVFTIEVDVSGLKHGTDSESISASVSNASIVDSKGQYVNVTGTAKGNEITVTPVFYLPTP